MGPVRKEKLVSSPATAGEFVKSAPCLCFGPNEPVCGIVEKMREHHIYAVVIAENEDLAGLLTGHDILVRATAWRSRKAPTMESVAKAFNILKAEDVMIKNPRTIESGTPLDEAHQTMIDNGCRYLPVMDGKRPVGILNIVDVSQYMTERAQQDSEEKDAIISYVMGHENYGCVPRDKN